MTLPNVGFLLDGVLAVVLLSWRRGRQIMAFRPRR